MFKIGGIGNYSELIIIKTAQPGAVIGQYNEDIRNGYFTATMNKINVVKNALANEGKTPKFYIFYSQGINNQRYSDLSDDAHFPNLRGSEYWLAATRVYLNKLVANTSNDTKVCVSKFWDEYGDYVNGRIDQLTNDNPTHFSSVNTANLSRQGDRLHLDTPSNKSLFLQMYYKMS